MCSLTSTTTTTHSNPATFFASTTLPTIVTTRTFAFPRSQVYRAHAQGPQAIRWMGPRDLDATLHHWDARRGGAYAFDHVPKKPSASASEAEKETAKKDAQCPDNTDPARVPADGVHRFYGSFHDAVEGERLVRTFTYVPWGEFTVLDTVTFEDVQVDGDGKEIEVGKEGEGKGTKGTKVVVTAIHGSFEARDGMLYSGMKEGMQVGYERLDELLREMEKGEA